MCLPSTLRRTVVIPMTSQFGCLKLLITRTFLSGPVKFEITRVDCICDEDDALFGVSADNNRGILYVCKRNKRQVCAWSADLSNHRTLLTHTDGLCDFLRCLAFSSANSQLLISSEVGNNLSIYLSAVTP